MRKTIAPFNTTFNFIDPIFFPEVFYTRDKKNLFVYVAPSYKSELQIVNSRGAY